MAGSKFLPVPKTFWGRLQTASEFADVPCTPADIARELAIWDSAVTKYVQGGSPSTKNINRLAIKRGVAAEWLKSGQGPMVLEKALDEETLELLKLWRAIDDDARKRLLANARYEQTAAENINTGKRRRLTDSIIRQLEAGKPEKPQ